MHHVSLENLRYCFHQLAEKRAVGVDGVRKEEYGKELNQNLAGLGERLKRFSYRPQPVRRVMIPKENGKMRPLGISTTEDKIVQSMVAKILQAIFEPDFLPDSHGFRPHKGCHTAIQSVYQTLLTKDVRYVVDIDIQAYFDTMDHTWLIRCLKERISDRKFLRLIIRMLKSGVLSEGEFHASDTGAPQGSIVSPILSNILLHYVFDTWFDRIVKTESRGYVSMCRYADDIVTFFRSEAEARQFQDALPGRLAQFGLTMNPEKTRMIHFDRRSPFPGTFNFIGFTFYWGKTKQGKRIIKCKTSKKRFRQKVKQFKVWIQSNRNRLHLSEIWKMSERKLMGHDAYYGVSWNWPYLNLFHFMCQKLLFKWLNRRSQRRSFNWQQFNEYCKRYPLPKPKMNHNLFQPIAS
jgi:group II intron reverse transcriptase/maturase